MSLWPSRAVDLWQSSAAYLSIGSQWQSRGVFGESKAVYEVYGSLGKSMEIYGSLGK